MLAVGHGSTIAGTPSVAALTVIHRLLRTSLIELGITPESFDAMPAVDVPRALFLAGLAFAAGGAALDVVATVLHTPDLSLEENPVARALLDGGHSLSFVYGYAFVCQALLVALLAVVWAASRRPPNTRVLVSVLLVATLYRATGFMWHLDGARFTYTVQDFVTGEFASSAIGIAAFRLFFPT